MKKVIAYTSLILLCVGYASCILLKTYNQENNTSTSVESNTAYHFLVNSSQLLDASSDDQFSTQEFIAIEALATSIGKIKLPDASSCPVITATFTVSPYPLFYNSTVFNPAQVHLQPAPIFLQNCVLRI